YQQSEIIGKSALSFIHPEDTILIAEALKNAYKTENVISVLDYRLIHKDGRIVNAAGQGKYVNINGNEKFIAAIRNISIQKQTEAKLKESEEKYGGILENIKESYFEVDLKGNFSFFNDSFTELLGYSRDELINSNYRVYVDEENKQKMFKAYNDLYNKGKPNTNFQFQVIRKDGIEVICESSVYLRYDSNGEKIGFSGFARDITEKFILEQKIKESEENYHTIFNASPDYIYVTDVEGNLLDANQSLLRRIGVSIEELRQTNFLNYFAGDNLETIMESFKDLTTGKEITGLEVRAKNIHGEIFEYEVNSVPLKKEGEVTKILNLARDITEKKDAEQKLIESEIKYRHLFENSPYSIILINRKGEVIDCNPATEKIFQRTVDDLLNRSFLDLNLKPENLLPLFNDRYKSILEGNVSKPIEVQIIRSSDDRPIWISIDDTLVEIGGETSFQVIIQDITEKKIAEQKLHSSQEDLKNLNRELEQKVKERSKDLIESERQYRTTINSLGDPMHVINEDLKVMLVNQAIKKWLTDLKIDSDIVGKNLFEVFPFLPPVIEEEYKQVFKTGIPIKTIETTILPDLDAITETRKIPIFSGGKVNQIITIIRDITESKELENQLKESEEKYRNMVNDLDVGFYKGEFKGKLLVHNQSMARILELAPNQNIIGKETNEFFPDPKMREKYYRELEENGFIRNFIAQIRKVNGDIITIDLNAHLIYDSEGIPIEVEGTFADITEKFILQQELL
ncbi:MAG: PAS domain S-box protein, partial [Promethearchaeota archaeon]